MQKQGIKIALLDKRMACYSIVNEARIQFINCTDATYPYIQARLGCTTQEQGVQSIDAICSKFLKAAFDAEFLFSKDISNKLQEIATCMCQYNAAYKEVSLFINNLKEDVASENPEASQIFQFALAKAKEIERGKRVSERELMICLGFSENHPYLTLADKLKNEFSDNAFFTKFLPYMDVSDLEKG